MPGVGAIYNGQYAKGLVHVVIFGMLVSILSSGSAGQWEPLFGIFLAAWVFYMAFEAYHTASKRQQGLAVDEFSSLISMHAEDRLSRRRRCFSSHWALFFCSTLWISYLSTESSVTGRCF